MTDLLDTLDNLAHRDAVGLLVIVMAVIAILHTAVGLGRTRQWYVLPVVFGLTALAGFLLNPLADSTTLLDLKSQLTSYETLTLLCIIQFALVGISVLLGFGIVGKKNEDRNAICLAVVGAIPAPVLVIAMLFLEHETLASSTSARPEAVGREIGLAMAAMLTSVSGAAMCIPGRWLAGPHLVVSAAMILVCMFTPFLQDPLPQPMATVDWQSLKLLAVLAPVLAAVALAGFWRAGIRLKYVHSDKYKGTSWEY